MQTKCVFELLTEKHPDIPENLTLEFKRLMRDNEGCTREDCGACSKMELRRYPKGSTVVRDGDKCHYFLVWLSGTALVFGSGPQGRQISLGRVRAGQCCPIIAASLMSGNPSPVSVVSEREAIVGAVPKSAFDHCMAGNEAFRHYILERCTEPLADMISLVKDVTFTPVNMRVAKKLLEASRGDGEEVEITHQRLAQEVGSAREVISRELRKFKQNGWIETGRRNIRVLNTEALREFVNPAN